MSSSILGAQGAWVHDEQSRHLNMQRGSTASLVNGKDAGHECPLQIPSLHGWNGVLK